MPRSAPPASFSRRDVLRCSVAALLACEATGMPSAYAESAFTIGTLGGSWGDGIRKAFSDIPGFPAKSKVQPVPLNAPYPVLVSRLLAQPANPPFTVADLVDIEHFMVADAGTVQDYDLSIVTNYKDIYPTATHAPRAGLKNWCASMTLPIISLAYNSKLAPRPTGWSDLWNPKFKGRVAIPDFGWYGQTFLHAVNKDLGGTEDNLDKGIAAVADLVRKNEAIVLKTTEQALKAFSDEQIVMMPFWNGRAFSLQAEGLPIEMAYVPNTIQLRNGFVIAKNTPFREAANQFVNNSLDPVLQLEMTRMFRYPPANRNAKLPPDLARYAMPEAALERVAKLDWARINVGRVSALERWNKEIIG